MRRIYRYSKKQLQVKLPGLYGMLDKRKTIVKYLISGGTAAATDLVLLYILTDILGIYYLLSASLAFIVAFFVSFFLQKFWTFRDNRRDKMYQQMTIYFIVGLTNLGINTGGMYLLVSKMIIPYLLAQIIMGLIIAIGSFLIYRFIIFNKKEINLDDNKFKVLIATGIFPPDIGGPARMLEALTDELVKKDLKVRIITYAEEDQGVNNRAYNYPVIKVIKSRYIYYRHAKYFLKMLKLAKWADLLYVTDTYSVGRFAYLIKKLLGKKYIIRFAGDSAWEVVSIYNWIKDDVKTFQEKSYNETIEKLKQKRKKILINADGVIAVSNFMNQHAQNIGVQADKIKTIYNSVDFIKYETDSKLKEKLNIDNNRIILTGGRLIPIKGIDYLIEAFNLLKEDKNFSNVKLLIVGDGPEEDNLKKIAQQSKWWNDIIFTGRVPMNEIYSYYKHANVFVLNSIHESFSHMLLEALRMEKPVIATYGGGNPEIVENEKTGLLVNYGDIHELNQALKRILTEEKWRGEEFKEKCRVSLKRFSWENNIYLTYKFINNIINE